MGNWERYLPPTARGTERQKRIERAVAHIEPAALGQAVSPSLTNSLAVVLLEVLRDTDRMSRDLERVRGGVEAMLVDGQSIHHWDNDP